MKRALFLLLVIGCSSEPKPAPVDVPPAATVSVAAVPPSRVPDPPVALEAPHEEIDAGAVAVAPVKGSAEIGPSTQTGSVADVDRVVAGIRPRFRACYNQALSTDPTIKGNLKLTFVIDTKGEPSNISHAPTTIPDAVLACIERAIARAQFTAPNKPATVTVPIILDRQQ